jgi:rhodanese-related sulfurtransferase
MTPSIGREELRDLIDSGDVVVVDALPSSYYDQQHLPGALNLVEADVDSLAPRLLPDRDAPIVTYCSNAACSNSDAVARRLVAAGYTNVRVYRDGIQDWVESGHPTESAVPA